MVLFQNLMPLRNYRWQVLTCIDLEAHVRFQRLRMEVTFSQLRGRFLGDLRLMAVIGDRLYTYSRVHDIVERALRAGLADAKGVDLSGHVDNASRQVIG